MVFEHFLVNPCKCEWHALEVDTHNPSDQLTDTIQPMLVPQGIHLDSQGSWLQASAKSCMAATRPSIGPCHDEQEFSWLDTQMPVPSHGLFLLYTWWRRSSHITVVHPICRTGGEARQSVRAHRTLNPHQNASMSRSNNLCLSNSPASG